MNIPQLVYKIILNMLRIEGIYITDDPDDPGGLTCCGISKPNHPNWKGWELIAKGDRNLAEGSLLLNLVIDFYHDLWNKYGLSEVPMILAEEMFDQIVNPGPKAMVTNLQNILNALNYKNEFGKDLVVDGRWGKNTRGRLMDVLKKGHVDLVAKSMNMEQAHYYLVRSNTNITLRKYYKGWLKQRCFN